jgi:murein DD-endopeptidase MepM/ murein hydrolase activator NlpD
MMHKVTCSSTTPFLEKFLISFGGRLRSIDAQIVSWIGLRPVPSFGISNRDLNKIDVYSDIPEWIYPYSSELTSWRYNRSTPWAGVSVAIPARPPFALLHPSAGLSQFWSASYQISTALSVLFPITLHAVQSPPPQVFEMDLWRGVEAKAVGRLNSARAKATPVKGATPKPVTVVRKPSQPTGRIANIQSYVLPAKGEFTSGYGWRWGRLHRGIDIAGPVGTPVLAAASGKVVTAGWQDDGFGYKVEIRHPDGTTTLYGHNSKILTKVGAQVRQGAPIAEMGSSGYSTGSHVHFQIQPAGKQPMDPIFFFGNQLKKTQQWVS